MFEKLFEKGKIGSLTTANRFVAQPMEGNCADAGGAVSQLTLDKYRKQAAGDWGTLIVEAISITHGSLARKNCLVIDRKNLDSFKHLVSTIKTVHPEVVVLFQITHSGSVSNPEFSERVAVSPLSEGRLLSSDEISRIRDGFAEGALLAEKAGADGIDYKCCHGYLGAEMLRPMNIRDDRWGGSWENRTRFLREGIGEIMARRKNSHFVVGSRISMYEGIRGGCGTTAPDELIENLGEQLRLLELMNDLKMDYVNISAGIPAKTPVLTRPVPRAELMYLHHLRYTRLAKEHLQSIGSAMQVIGSAYSVLGEKALPVAEEMLTRGYADLIGWGRQTLADPLTPAKLRDSEPVNYCAACSGCSQMMIKQIHVGCILHDEYFKKYWQENR